MNISMFGHKRIPSREGGVEVVVEELAARMVQAGHQVICYNRGSHHTIEVQYDAKRVDHYKGIKLKTVPTVDIPGIAAVTSSFFAALCTAFNKTEIVHIHAEGPAFMCWLPKLFGKRVVVTVHGIDWQREKWKDCFAAKYIRAGEKAAVRFADEIIVLSRSMQKYFRDTYSRETVFIPNGVNRPEIREADGITRMFGLKKDGYLLFVGRFVLEKGIHYLIEAFRKVKTCKKLVIAGECSDSDDYCRSLKVLAAGDGRILFPGFLRGRLLEELYSNAYVYVLPSDLEGMSLSLLEAMSYGNCCLVSDIPECTEVVEDRALFFPRGDTDALQAQLQRLCDEPDLVNRYRQGARDFICEKYHWDETAVRTLALYRRGNAYEGSHDK